MSTPKVSVALIVYNHERFVQQAMESALAQRTDFEFEIVLGEDCSTDGTRRLVQRLAAEHPDRIRLLLPEKNLGLTGNVIATIAACRGEYVALLEGDDFWIDPEKLQRQADLLDRNRGLALCFTRAQVVDETGAPIETKPVIHEVKPTYTLHDFLDRVFQPRTCTVMFRNRLFARFPDWYHGLPAGDFPLHVLNAEHGDFGFLDRTTAAYRIHAGGVWSLGFSPKQWQGETREHLLRYAARMESVLRVYQAVRGHLAPRHEAVTRKHIAKFAHQLTYACRLLEDWPRMRRSVAMQLRALPPPPGVGVGFLLRAWLVCRFPFLARRPAPETACRT